MWLGLERAADSDIVAGPVVSGNRKRQVWLAKKHRGLASYRFTASSLYAMADLNPHPLFPPANAGGNAADSGGVTIIHGEIPPPAMGPEVPIFILG